MERGGEIKLSNKNTEPTATVHVVILDLVNLTLGENGYNGHLQKGWQ